MSITKGDGFAESVARVVERDGPQSTVAKRIRIEGRIVRKLIKSALAVPGNTVSVYDGEVWCLTKSSDYAAIMAALNSTDDDQLMIRDKDGNKLGWVRLIYGNDGYDVISDYSISLDELFMKQVQSFVDMIERTAR
jgi:hypothetical protein